MKNEVTHALDIIREMSIQKMINLKFITKEQIDQYIKDQFLKDLRK